MSDLSLFLTNTSVSLGQTMETHKVSHCETALTFFFCVFTTIKPTFFADQHQTTSLAEKLKVNKQEVAKVS